MIDVLIWIALTMSIAPAVLVVWLFNHLVGGGIIVGNSYNLIELILAIAILVCLIAGWVGFTIRKLRR